MSASTGYGRTSLVLGLCIAALGLALAVRSGFSEGVLALAMGSWITVRSVLRIARPRGDRPMAYGAALRRAGVQTTLLGVVVAAVIVLGSIGVIPAFPGRHRWPFLVLIFPAVVFLYGGIRAIRVARQQMDSSP